MVEYFGYLLFGKISIPNVSLKYICHALIKKKINSKYQNNNPSLRNLINLINNNSSGSRLI